MEMILTSLCCKVQDHFTDLTFPLNMKANTVLTIVAS